MSRNKRVEILVVTELRKGARTAPEIRNGAAVDEAPLRRAIWRLLASGKVYVTADNKLRLTVV